MACLALALAAEIEYFKWKQWAGAGYQSIQSQMAGLGFARQKELFRDRRPDEKTITGTHQYWKKNWVFSREIPSDLDIGYAYGFLSVAGRTYRVRWLPE